MVLMTMFSIKVVIIYMMIKNQQATYNQVRPKSAVALTDKLQSIILMLDL